MENGLNKNTKINWEARYYRDGDKEKILHPSLNRPQEEKIILLQMLNLHQLKFLTYNQLSFNKIT